MELWVRIALVAAAVVGGFALGMMVTKPVLLTMIRAAGKSVGRALLVVFGYYTAMIVLAGVFGMVAAVLYRAGWLVATVGVMCLGLLAISPFVYPLMSSVSAQTGTQPLTSRRELTRLGADPKVARAIAWTGVVLSLVPGLVILFVFAVVPLVIGR